MLRKAFYPVFIIASLVAVVMMGSCRKEQARPVTEHTPEGMDINEFAEYFADMAGKNQRDSLYGFYPDVIKADSIAFTSSGQPVSIRELGDGRFEIYYGPSMRIIVKKDDKGNIAVLESFGLFAYDSLRTVLAHKSGLWNDSINDIVLDGRMKDEGFFRFLEERSKVTIDDLLQIGDPVYDSEDGISGHVPVYNLTDSIVYGDDYIISIHSLADNNGQEENQMLMAPGRDINPKDTIMVEVINSPNHIIRVTGVKFKLSQEQVSEKYAPLTGNEYRQYLEQKEGAKE